MKTFVVLFGSSAAFGAAIAVTYFFVAHQEAAGTALLGIMTAALAFTAGYAVVAERDADLEGDDPNARRDEASGEIVGVFTTSSAYPIVIALIALCTLLGLLFVPLLGGVSLLALVYVLWRMGAESART
ncbi:MAG TPA: cytochrome c oxidase subunit 4 [Candidatus Acidoferrales bacterium]|nr:cytochrome c oxidase subunit 4 [Candidatus Acidoferrales bacterium]